MSESVNLPALGESVTEGTVTRWLKQVGDRVEVDEPLLEVSTDKVDTEIPSPIAGVIEEILVAASGEILAIPENILENLRILDPVFKNKWFGCPIGIIKGTDFIPGHALVFSDLLKPVPTLDLSREQALTFLKKETFPVPSNAPLGWTLATYSGLSLGWIKILPNRMNNYLPPERRIRMDVKGR